MCLYGTVAAVLRIPQYWSLHWAVLCITLNINVCTPSMGGLAILITALFLVSLIYNYMKNIMFTRLPPSPSSPHIPLHSHCPSAVKSLLVFSVLHSPPRTPHVLYMLIVMPPFFFPALIPSFPPILLSPFPLGNC